MLDQVNAGSCLRMHATGIGGPGPDLKSVAECGLVVSSAGTCGQVLFGSAQGPKPRSQTQHICQSLGSWYFWQRGCLSEPAKGIPSPAQESEPVAWDLGALGGARSENPEKYDIRGSEADDLGKH